MKSAFMSVVLLCAMSLSAFAQSAPSSVPASPAPIVAPVSAPVSAPAVVAPATSSNVMTAIQNAVNSLPTAIPAWILAVIGFLVELLLRFYPTLKPKSLLIYASSFLSLISSGFLKLSGILDQVAQNVNDPGTPPTV